MRQGVGDGIAYHFNLAFEIVQLILLFILLRLFLDLYVAVHDCYVIAILILTLQQNIPYL